MRLILAREELRADEFSKFQAALMWSKKYCDSTNGNIADTLGSFLEFINFHMIPANVLMKEIHPLGLVPYHIIMNALAYQVIWAKGKTRTRALLTLTLTCVFLLGGSNFGRSAGQWQRERAPRSPVEFEWEAANGTFTN